MRSLYVDSDGCGTTTPTSVRRGPLVRGRLIRLDAGLYALLADQGTGIVTLAAGDTIAIDTGTNGVLREEAGGLGLCGVSLGAFVGHWTEIIQTWDGLRGGCGCVALGVTAAPPAAAVKRNAP